MWMTRVAIAHPVFATMVMVALTVLGIFSYARLGVQPLPDVSPPGLSIWIAYPGASPEQVENDLAKPVENAVNTVAGVKRLLSRSDEGRSLTWVEFRYDVDMTRATQEVRDKLAQIRASFPREAKDPVVQRINAEDQEPVATFALLSGTRTPRELTLLAEQVVQKGFERVNGVGRVELSGTVTRQVQVRIDPARLTALGLTVDQVLSALRTANVSVAVGTVYNATAETIVRVDGRLVRPEQFEHIIVARRNGVPILLSQGARVSDAERAALSLSRVDGQPANGVRVWKAQDANIVEVGRELKTAAEGIRKQLPSGVELKFMWAESDFVEQSVDNGKRTIVEGALLTVLIVFLFLGSWRSTVITGLTLPISVIATFIALYALGFTLNYMTLMALSLVIGLLIDDAIVVRENIVRHLRMGKDHVTAAREGTDEIGLAVLATTLSIVAVFVPIAFMSGLVGKFFHSFGLTVVVAVLLSMFVSFTLDPMLSAVWRDPPEGATRLPVVGPVLRTFDRWVERWHIWYGRLLDWALAHRKTTLAIATASFLASFPIAAVVGTEMVPETDQSYTSIRLTLPVGSSLEYANERVKRVEAVLAEFREIESIDTNIGTDGARNGAIINLKLVPRAARERTQKQIEEAIRARVASIPGVELKVGWNQPIYVALLGNNDAEMQRVIADLKEKVKAIPGITDIETSVKEGTPALAVRLRPELAAEYGITHAQLGSTLRALVEGENAGYWLAPDGQNYEVVVQLTQANRALAEDISNLNIATGRQLADGSPEVVPLRAIATVEKTFNPENIRRQNLQRRVA
ncbi:MAG: efflux RND transporter permease subunit, partial [Betaproteobacteria bacterium]